MMQRIRLPGVNDIFPTQSATSHCAPQVMAHEFAQHIHINQPAQIPLHSAGHNIGQPLSVIAPGTGLAEIKQQFDPPVHSILYQPTPKQIISPLGHPVYTINGIMHPPIYLVHSPQYYNPSASQGLSPTLHVRGKVARKGNRGHRKPHAWSSEDDCLLKHLKEVRKLGWREISLHFKDRTANGCQFRWRRISLLQRTTYSVVPQ